VKHQSHCGRFGEQKKKLDPAEYRIVNKVKGKGKSVLLQAWGGLEGSRKLRFPDFVKTAQDGGKVVSLTYWPPLPPRNTPGTHFCYRLCRPLGHNAIGRILCQ